MHGKPLFSQIGAKARASCDRCYAEPREALAAVPRGILCHVHWKDSPGGDQEPGLIRRLADAGVDYILTHDAE